MEIYRGIAQKDDPYDTRFRKGDIRYFQINNNFKDGYDYHEIKQNSNFKFDKTSYYERCFKITKISVDEFIKATEF